MPKILMPGERGRTKVTKEGTAGWRARGSVKLPDGRTYRGDQRGNTRAMALAKLNDELDRAIERAGSEQTRTGVYLTGWLEPRMVAAVGRRIRLPRGEKSRWSPGTAHVYQYAEWNIWPESAPDVRETDPGELDRRRMDRSTIQGVGEIPLGKLSTADIEALFDSLVEPGGPRYRAAELAGILLRRTLDEAVTEGLIRDNPAGAARLPRQDELDDHPAELAALSMETIRDVYRALETFQLRSGWRCGVEGRDIQTCDSPAPLTTVERADSSQKPRYLAISESLQDVLRSPEVTAGMVKGYDYIELAEPIKQLKREGRLKEALILAYQAIGGAENDARAIGREPALAYTLEAAIVHRKLGQHDEERAVLERWMTVAPKERREGSRVAERLAKLDAKSDQAQ